MGIGASVIGALRVVLGMDVAEFEEGSKKAQSSMDQLARKAETVGKAIGAAFVADKIGAFARESLRAFGEQEAAVAAVEAAIKSMGGGAGFTTGQLVKMAEKLKEVSTFDDDQILSKVTANLLTFGNVVGPVFEKAQMAALNLSARFGQDLQSSTIQLGKALQDPIAGLTKLQRVGVSFTQAQKEQIKTLVASNQVMTAQKIILAELEKEFGGQAEALANTTQGKLKQAAIAFGDAMKAVGAVIAPAVLPAAQAVKEIAKAFQDLNPHTQTFIIATAGIAAGIAAAVAAAAVGIAVFGGLSLPILGIVAAVAVVGAALFAWRENIGRVASAIGGYFYSIYEGAKRYLYDALKPIIDAVGDWVAKVGDAFSWLGKQLDLGTAVAILKEDGKQMVLALQPYQDKLAEIWNGTEKWKTSLESTKAPQMVVPKGYDPNAITNAQKELNKAIQEGVSIAKQAESPWAKYNREIKGLNAALDAGKITANQYNLAQKKIYEDAKINYEGGAELIAKYQTPYEQMTEKVRKLNEQYAAGAISATALGRAQQQAALAAAISYADMASSIAGNLSTVFAKNKAIAIATGTIDAIGAALKAFAAYSPPFSYIAAAAALAAGIAKVAAIKSTSEGGGGGGASASAPAAMASASAPAAAASTPAALSSTLLVQGISSAQMFTGDVVRDLAGRLLDYQRDGGKVVLA